jgi:copper chaperone CopZ
MSRQYRISGLSCSHCVASVREEVESLPGVEDAHVDLASGRLTVQGDAEIDAIRAAVREAGYEVVA